VQNRAHGFLVKDLVVETMPDKSGGAERPTLVVRVPAIEELESAEDVVDYDPSATVAQVEELHPGFSRGAEEDPTEQFKRHPSQVQRPVMEPYPFTLLSPITTYDENGLPTPPPGVLKAKPGSEAVVLYNEVMQYVSFLYSSAFRFLIGLEPTELDRV
jgi:hypothetical protein